MNDPYKLRQDISVEGLDCVGNVAHSLMALIDT